jgi:hypothetical protein
MNRLRIGFLLPCYSRYNKSSMPRVMRALSEWVVVVDVMHPADRVVDMSPIEAAPLVRVS